MVLYNINKNNLKGFGNLPKSFKLENLYKLKTEIYGYFKFRMGCVNDNVYIFVSSNSLGPKWFLII
jgi:hypothetical protein